MTITTEIVALAVWVGIPYLLYQAMTNSNNDGKGKDVSWNRRELVAVFVGIVVIWSMAGQTISMPTEGLIPSNQPALVDPSNQSNF